MFNHIDVDIDQLKRKNTENGRRYLTPSGALYPSVTTILSHKSKPYIDAWKKRIGHAAANKISTQANAFVSNHISFLDIIVLNSIIPSNFIAKSEIKSWPIIGHLAGKTGTIFIKRGDTEDNDSVINIMREYIAKDKNMIFFPEGRIGDGIKVRKFHSKLFNSVSKTNSNLQSIFIRYPVDYPKNMTSDSSVCWADKTQTLLKITLRCLGRKNTKVLLYFGELIDTSDKEAHELAKKSANSVLKSFGQL